MLSFFLPLFMVFLFLGLPVFFGLIAAPGLLLFLNGQERDIVLLYRNVYNGMDSFPLMAIPFFMLAGEVMNRSNITLRLVEFSQAMIGHFRGGLAHVNVLSSMLFAGLSGWCGLAMLMSKMPWNRVGGSKSCAGGSCAIAD